MADINFTVDETLLAITAEGPTDSDPFSRQENSDNSLKSALGAAAMLRRYGLSNA